MPPLTLTYRTDAMRRLNEGGGVMAVATGAEKKSTFTGEKRCNSKKMITFAPNIHTKQKNMATMTFPRQLLVTVDGSTNIANVTRAIRMLRGVTAIKTATRKPRLYDPETGECLNAKTMKAIEDVRSGKDKGTTYESFEEFKKAMLAL